MPSSVTSSVTLIDTPRVRENRARRALRRQGFALSKSRARDPGNLDFDRYVIADGAQAVIAGAFPGSGLTISEVELWLFAEEGHPAPEIDVLCSEALDGLRRLPSGSVKCIVTSPPYYFVRDYDHPDQVGLERSRAAYIDRLATILGEAFRVLADDGTMWLNVGDNTCTRRAIRPDGMRSVVSGQSLPTWREQAAKGLVMYGGSQFLGEGIREGSLFNVPHMLVEALRPYGWIYRAEVHWIKTAAPSRARRNVPTPMIEPIFMLTKRASGYTFNPTAQTSTNAWMCSPSRVQDTHSAMMPLQIAKWCIEISTDIGEMVLDPFAGLGTTAQAARELGRWAQLFDINPRYATRARQRLGVETK